MKLRNQILAIGVAGALAAALTGAIGYFALMRMGDSATAAILGGKAMQASQEADMMHDALRGTRNWQSWGRWKRIRRKLPRRARGFRSIPRLSRTPWHGCRNCRTAMKLARR